MAKITRRAALLSVIGIGAGAGIGIGVAVSSKGTPSAEPIASPSTETASETPSATPTPRPSPSPSPAVDTRPRWPLTGKLLKDPGRAHHIAVAVKVPDNQVEHPQRGLNQADIVFVELDGYRDASGHSGTRLMPVFHSKMADTVEPVRSIRPVDIPLLSPIHAVIGNTGAAPWVINYVKHYKQYVVGMLSYMATRGTGSYGTDPSRVYQFGGQTYYDRATTCHPAVLAKQTKKFSSGPPQPYFPWASHDAEVSATNGKKATSMSIPYKGQSYRMSYSYDAKTKRYKRNMPWGPHVLADGTRVTTDNVLVIKSKQSYGKIYHGAGHDEPLYAIIDGKGTFLYFHGGHYVTGTWTKGDVNQPFQLTLPDGTSLKMAPGQTYVELPDVAAKIKIRS